jgi:PAS domain S-box-containing protein
MDYKDASHILIIEDEDILAKICLGHLESQGHTVQGAATGKDGLEVFRTDDKLGVVVTDVKLPDISGLDILSEIKKIRPNTEVIVITAFPNYDVAINALKLGADDYLEKPFRMEVLQRTVEKALERYHLRLENQIYQQHLAELLKEKSSEVEQSHEQLASEHRKLKALINGIEAGIFFTDQNNIVLEINEYARRIVGKPYQQIIGSPCHRNPILKKVVKHAKNVAASHNLLEDTAPPSDVCLNRRWFSANVTPLTAADTDSGFDRKIYTFYNVTERRNLERRVQKYARVLERRVEESTFEMKKAMEFSALLLDAARVFAFFAASNRRITLWNKFAQDLTGINASDAADLDIFYRLLPNCHPGTRIPFEADIIKQADSGKFFQTSLKTARGDVRIISWTATPILQDKHNGGILFIGVDVTDQKRLEDKLQQYNTRLEEMVEARTAEVRSKDAQLVHSSRLAVLGEIAAGIAHEMKQPLNGISITADLLKLLQKKNELTEDTLNSNLDMIKSMVDRMANTINHLRGFSYQGANQFNPVSIADAVDGSFSILGEQIRVHGIEVRKDIQQDLPNVLGDLNQIEQVLINLFTNARDAMDKKEKDGQYRKGEEKVLAISMKLSNDDSCIVIEVSDTGHGIDSEYLEHIFEPFFTTKDSNDGTGLGLSISQGIVEQHHGTMSAKSTPGKGTTFHIELPVVKSAYETTVAK